MKRILVFAGSNSSTSINQQLVTFVASKIDDFEVSAIRLTDYPLSIYSEDIEKEGGFSDVLQDLLDKISASDGLIISVNEHNSGISAFFKNTLDWLSRIERSYLEGKKVFLLSTSPGKRGGLSALEFTKNNLPRVKGEVVSAISVPSFYENFSVEEQKIVNSEIDQEINGALQAFLKRI